MEQIKENTGNELEKIALICDGLQQLYPSGKHAIIFELENNDYKKIQTNFREIDKIYKRFQIDLSGVECVFIDKNLYEELESEKKKQEEETLNKKYNLFAKFKKLFT
jgi:hypothetical protein